MGPFIILAIGLLLIYLEFFLPGGIMGTCGGILVVVSIGMFGGRSESLAFTSIFALVAVIATASVVRFALWRIQIAAPDHSVYLNGDQEGYVASGYDLEAVGKEGEAQSDLKPSGHVLVSGRRHQAISTAGYVEKGSSVKVTGGRGAYLTVKPCKKEKNT